jgi:hypothetical protein
MKKLVCVMLLSVNVFAVNPKMICESFFRLDNLSTISKGNTDTISDRQIDRICTLVESIALHESGLNYKAFNPEKTGSYGLMQIQCATARRLGHDGSCVDLFDPYLNIRLGQNLIIHLFKRYKTIEDVLAAYNAGSVIKNDDGYINKEYVAAVLNNYKLAFRK